MKEFIDFIGLGIIIATIMTLALLLRDQYVKNFDEINKNSIKTYSSKQIAIGVCLLLPMGLWLVINLSIQNLVLLEVGAGTSLISFTAYVLTKNKLALLSGIGYPLLYYYQWNMFTLNCIAMLIALGSILVVSRYIKPKQMLLICGLIVIYDFIMVYITTDMITAAHRIIDAQLPMYVYVQLTHAKGILLGLGDVLFAGLLVIKIAEWKNYDLRTGMNFVFAFCAIIITSLAIAIQITPGGVPATIPIMIAAGLSIVFFELKAFGSGDVNVR